MIYLLLVIVIIGLIAVAYLVTPPKNIPDPRILREPEADRAGKSKKRSRINIE